MSIAENAKQVYDNELKKQLETDHWGAFVAIEPISKSYFLGDSFIEAAMAAKTAYPERPDGQNPSLQPISTVISWPILSRVRACAF